jgi:hypothetical protein
LFVKARKQPATRGGQEAALPSAITRFGAFAVCIGLFTAAAAAQSQFNNHQVAQGMAIYLGVLPAKVTRDEPPPPSSREMHRGTPEWGEQYHVMVALFEDESGKRITDAGVRATVFDARQPGKRLAGPQKQLEPMLVAGRTNYGNYFNMPAPGPYRIELEIRREGESKITKASFEFRHAIVPTRSHR